MQFHSLVHLLGGNILNDRSAAFRLPRILLHQKYVDKRVEPVARLYRILYLDAFRTVNVLHAVYYRIKITLLAVKLVDKENNRLFQLLRVTEVILRANFRAILAVNQYQSLVCYVKSRYRTADKIVRTGTVDDIKFLVVPLYIKNG